MASVKLIDVEKRWGGVVGVARQSLDIADGEFVVFLGPSGCGKTTTMRMVAGLEEPSAGEIWIGGRDVTDALPKDRDVAMVFQNYGLYPHLTVGENIAYPLKVRGMGRAERTLRAREVADKVELGHLLDRRPRDLSGGQRQRVALARAIVRRPQVFLMDEPLSNLDAKLRVSMRAEIRRLQCELRITTIYVTHDQIEALTLADRIAIMKSGVIQQLADPVTIYNKPRNLFVAGFIGSPSMNFLRGELIEKDGKVVFTTNGVTFALDGYHAEAPLAAGRAVVLGVRPEHVRVDADIVGGEVHEAIVDIEEPMGADNLIWLKHAGHTMSVRVGGHRRFSPGTKVRLGLDLTMASLFDAESEERL